MIIRILRKQILTQRLEAKIVYLSRHNKYSNLNRNKIEKLSLSKPDVEWKLLPENFQSVELFVFFQVKQHAHAEKVTVTAAYLIHIFQATVNYLKQFTISQIIHYSVQCRTQKQHLCMLSSVRLCCLSEIALILVLFSEFS